MNQEVAQQLTRARTHLLLDFPFFGELALRLRLVERPDVPTLAVDGRHIFYNPDFVAGLSPSLTKSAMGHEVLHPILDHIGRRGGRDPRKWNQAGDYVINAMLKDSGFEIGPNWLYDTAYAGMTTDQIYALLPNDDGSGRQPGGPGGHGGQDDPLDNCMDGDPDTTDIDATDWKIATIQAANAAKAMGKLPASLARFVEELTTPKVNWRERLRRFVTERSRNDYSWMRPNRRFISQGMYLPSLYSESMGEIVVAIDTSGSIGQEMLDAFGSEIKAIVQSARPSKTTVIYCDAEVNHVDTFAPTDDLKFAMHGGGGTDFRPPFQYVSEHAIRPVCFVYLTDMYGSFPTDPGYPVMWCATTEVVGPFGETISIQV